MNDAAIYINVVSCVDMCFPFSLVHARSATVGSRGNSNYWGTARFFQSSSTILHTLMTLVKHAVISREVHDQVSLLFTLFLPPFKNWQLQHFPGGLVVRTRLSLLRPRFNPWSCDPAKKTKKKQKNCQNKNAEYTSTQNSWEARKIIPTLQIGRLKFQEKDHEPSASRNKS